MIRIINDCTIIGLRKTKFTGSRGEDIYGYNVYFSYEPDGIEGIAADRVYVSAQAFKKLGLEIGSVISVAFSNKKYELVA